MAEAPPSLREETRSQGKTRTPFPSRFKERSARPMPKSNRVRAHPKAALRPAVASGCWRRAPPPPISKSQTENGGGPRRRPAPAGHRGRATRIGRAPFGDRPPSLREETRSQGKTRTPFPSRFKERSRSWPRRPMPKSNRVRAHPKAALRPAVAADAALDALAKYNIDLVVSDIVMAGSVDELRSHAFCARENRTCRSFW